nr:uncharacterized protein LOC129434993 [Misgurnus anguillicaudatus]
MGQGISPSHPPTELSHIAYFLIIVQPYQQLSSAFVKIGEWGQQRRNQHSFPSQGQCFQENWQQKEREKRRAKQRRENKKEKVCWYCGHLKNQCFQFLKCQETPESQTAREPLRGVKKKGTEARRGKERIRRKGYVDDLLVAAPTQQSCTDNTIRLLTHLAEEGHNVNPKKVQCSVQKVTFLGHEITSMNKSLSPNRIEVIANIPKPITKKQVMSFL